MAEILCDGCEQARPSHWVEVGVTDGVVRYQLCATCVREVRAKGRVWFGAYQTTGQVEKISRMPSQKPR